MTQLRVTLLTDGPSDQAILPIVRWLLQEHKVYVPMIPQWADPYAMPPSKGGQQQTLHDRIQFALRYFECDLLFVHRDAEGPIEKLARRRQEIKQAVAKLDQAWRDLPIVPVVPVRMTEAWFLIDEAALRLAAGNPKGETPLNLPRLNTLEKLADPKDKLKEILRSASGLTRRHRGDKAARVPLQTVAGYVSTFEPLRQLTAFRQFEADFSTALAGIRQRGLLDRLGSHPQSPAGDT